MDYFNLLVSMILIFLAMQYGQNWIIFAIMIISVLTIKSFRAIAVLVIGTLALYLLFDNGDLNSSFPLIVLGIAVVGLILGLGKGGGSEPQAGLPGGYGDLLGGLGGGGEGMYGGRGY